MGTDNTFKGGLLIIGDLNVTGTKPEYARSELTQESLAHYYIQPREWFVHDTAAVLPNTGAADDLGFYPGTFGTSPATIQTGDMKTLNTTRYARTLFQLPPEYVAAQTVEIRVRAGVLTNISDTTATIDFEVYSMDLDQTVSADLCTTIAVDINSVTAADKDFTITATALAPGSFLDIRMGIAINDAATGTAVIGLAEVVSIRCDIKG